MRRCACRYSAHHARDRRASTPWSRSSCARHQAGPHRQAHARERAAQAAEVRRQSERFSAEQKSLLEETLDSDLAAVADEIEQLHAAAGPRHAAKTSNSPSASRCRRNLPRREIRHEPESTTCAAAAR
jgi:hypothetical protein